MCGKSSSGRKDTRRGHYWLSTSLPTWQYVSGSLSWSFSLLIRLALALLILSNQVLNYVQVWFKYGWSSKSLYTSETHSKVQKQAIDITELYEWDNLVWLLLPYLVSRPSQLEQLFHLCFHGVKVIHFTNVLSLWQTQLHTATSPCSFWWQLLTSLSCFK